MPNEEITTKSKYYKCVACDSSEHIRRIYFRNSEHDDPIFPFSIDLVNAAGEVQHTYIIETENDIPDFFTLYEDIIDYQP